MLTATRDISGQFLVVLLQVTAGRLKQRHTMGLQAPFTSYGDRRGESPEGERQPSCCRAQAPPSSEAGEHLPQHSSSGDLEETPALTAPVLMGYKGSRGEHHQAENTSTLP